MLLTGDYHTHTTYSHGKGTVLENALAAKEKGLKEIAITDHGFEQMAFGIKRKKVPQLIKDCREATEKTGVKVYVGMEANLCDEFGRTDMTVNDYKDFDVFLMGIHRFVKFTRFKDFWNMFFVNFFYTLLKKEGSKSLMRYNTVKLQRMKAPSRVVGISDRKSFHTIHASVAQQDAYAGFSPLDLNAAFLDGHAGVWHLQNFNGEYESEIFLYDKNGLVNYWNTDYTNGFDLP